MEKPPLFDLIEYTAELRTLNNVSITEREVDIVASVINRRISDSSIAHQLDINKRTVETHLRNITQKLRCSTQKLREIVDDSGKAELFLNHYNLLILFKRFCEVFDKIKNTPQQVSTREYKIFYTDLELQSILNKIRTALDYVGMHALLEPFNSTLKADFISRDGNFLIVSTENDSMIPEDLKKHTIQFLPSTPVFKVILTIVEHLSSDIAIKELAHQFNQKTTTVIDWKQQSNKLSDPINTQITRNLSYSFFSFGNKSRFFHFTLVLLLSAVVLVGAARFYANDHPRSELHFPTQGLLLERSELVSIIKDKLHPYTSEPSISTVAICGIGGSGKTILARMIAKAHKGIVWEFNAETETMLIDSIKEFAYALAQSDEDRAKLKFISSLTNIKEQSKQVCMFVRNKLIQNPKWFLIFDNVESFANVNQYLPKDALAWGTGNVIITSRNAHFPSLEPNNIIKLGALSKNESVKLFSKIRWGREDISGEEQESLSSFLDKVPAFPLDVMLAANFLHQSPEMAYSQYLDRLNDNTFQIDQSDRLKATSDYTQTRHDIISVSLQKLLNNPTFLEMMVLIGLLDSQNIPKALLLKISDSASVERIIYELKKYSLITSESKVNGSNVFSMHRSIHTNLSQYILRYSNTPTQEHLLQKVIETFESYANEMVDTANYSAIYSIIPHIENMLTQRQLPVSFQTVLEVTYVNLLSMVPAHSVKTVPLLEKCLKILDKSSVSTPENSLRVARTLSMLGDRYRSLCRFSEAHQLLERSVRFYKELAPDSIEAAKTYGRLGALYRSEGNHKKTQELLLKSIEIYNKYPESYHPLDKLIALGLNARDVGDYKASLDYLNTNLKLVKDKNDPWRFWILSYLGSVYIETANYDKAWDCLQQAEKYFSQSPDGHVANVPYAWRLAYMGTAQVFQGKVDESLKTLEKSYDIFATLTAGREMHGICFKVVLPSMGYAYYLKKNYRKSEELLKESLTLLEKHYGKGHFQTARVITYLGMVALKEGRTNEAEQLLNAAVDILNACQHTDVFIPLEGLSDLFYEKSLNAKDAEKAELYKQKSKADCQQALEIVKLKMPSDSGHLKHLLTKNK